MNHNRNIETTFCCDGLSETGRQFVLWILQDRIGNCPVCPGNLPQKRFHQKKVTLMNPLHGRLASLRLLETEISEYMTLATKYSMSKAEEIFFPANIFVMKLFAYLKYVMKISCFTVLYWMFILLYYDNSNVLHKNLLYKYTMYVTFASKCWRWPVHLCICSSYYTAKWPTLCNTPWKLRNTLWTLRNTPRTSGNQADTFRNTPLTLRNTPRTLRNTP